MTSDNTSFGSLMIDSGRGALRASTEVPFKGMRGAFRAS